MEYLILTLLFLLPLFYLPFGPQQFEAPKVIIAEILICFSLGISIWKNQLKIPKNKLTLALLTIIFLMNLLSLSFPNPDKIYGNIFRLQGGLLLFLMLGLSLISYSYKSIFGFEKLTKFIPVITLFLLFILSFLFGTNKAGLIVGSLGEPNALAATAVFFYAVILFRSKLFAKILATPITLYLILQTQSRSAMLALLITLIFLICLKIKQSLTIPVILSLLLISLSLFFPFIEGGGWYENRSDIWKVSFASGLESPIFGHGFGNIQGSISSTAVKLDNNVKYQVIDSAHNFLLDYWIQGGILGLGAILTLVSLTLIRFFKSKQVLESVLFLAVITVMSFNPVSIMTLLVFWYLIGQGFTD